MFFPIGQRNSKTVDKNGPIVQGGLDGGEDSHRCGRAYPKVVHLGFAHVTEIPASLTVAGPNGSSCNASLGVNGNALNHYQSELLGMICFLCFLVEQI